MAPENEESSPDERKPSWIWIAAVVGLTFPLYVLLDQRGMPGTGQVAWVCVVTFCLVIWARWDLRGYGWFWTTIAAMAVLHVLVIPRVPWPQPAILGRRGYAFMIIPDLMLIAGAVRLVEKSMGHDPPSDERSEE